MTLSPEEVQDVCVNLVSGQHQELPSAPQSLSKRLDSLGMMGLADLGGLGASDIASCLKSAGTDCDALLASAHGSTTARPAGCAVPGGAVAAVVAAARVAARAIRRIMPLNRRWWTGPRPNQ